MYMLSTIISQTGECNAQHATDPCFLNQWGYSTLLLIIIGIGLVYLLFKKRKFLVDNLKWIAGTVFIAGFLIYWYAFNVFYDCHSYHLPVSVLLWCHSPPSFLIRHPGYAITLFNRLSLPVIVI